MLYKIYKVVQYNHNVYFYFFIYFLLLLIYIFFYLKFSYNNLILLLYLIPAIRQCPKSSVNPKLSRFTSFISNTAAPVEGTIKNLYIYIIIYYVIHIYIYIM